jgi:hypothetical protein
MLVGMIAKNKGRDFFPWWLYGTLLFIFAIVHVLIIRPDNDHLENEALASGGKKCPRCAEFIKAEALVCRFCSHEFDPASVTKQLTGAAKILHDQVG